MDGAHTNTTRKFPAYTIKELKSHLRNELTVEMRNAIETEIRAREVGKSVMFKVPQL